MAWLGIYLKSERFLIKSFSYICEGLVLVYRHFLKPRNVIGQCKKPTAQMAHLVFADTRANAQKTKRAIFLPTHGQTTRQKKVT